MVLVQAKIGIICQNLIIGEGGEGKKRLVDLRRLSLMASPQVKMTSDSASVLCVRTIIVHPATRKSTIAHTVIQVVEISCQILMIGSTWT